MTWKKILKFNTELWEVIGILLVFLLFILFIVLAVGSIPYVFYPVLGLFWNIPVTILWISALVAIFTTVKDTK